MKTTACILLIACSVVGGFSADKDQKNAGSPYLYVWAGDAAHKNPDFLAVIGADPTSSDYGRLITTVPVGSAGNMPHHTEYEFPTGRMLYAGGWASNTVYLFDMTNSKQPRVARQFTGRGGFSYAHSFVRLPNGHVLATFQSKGTAYAPPGGLVELDAGGEVIRSASASNHSVSDDYAWPYSLAVQPKLDRVIVSSTTMGMPEWGFLPPGSWPLERLNAMSNTRHVEIWRLSDLKLLSVIELPADAGHHRFSPAEPRVLPDGSVYVNTFTCGLFRLRDLTGPHPKADLVYAFPGGTDMDNLCAVPVVVGHYWIQTVPALPGLIALDVAHPEKPVEVSRLKFDSRYEAPHWLAVDRSSNRLIVTGDDRSWALIARLDPRTGNLSLDDSFREKGAQFPGFNFDRPSWPHGNFGKAVVHGALFGGL